MIIEGNYLDPRQYLELFFCIAQLRPYARYVIVIAELSSDFWECVHSLDSQSSPKVKKKSDGDTKIC